MVMSEVMQRASMCVALSIPLSLIAEQVSAAQDSDRSVYAQSGDISTNSTVVWARCNNEYESRIIIDLSTSHDFDDEYTKEVRSVLGPLIKADNDYTGNVLFQGLEAEQTYYYRARCVDMSGHDRSKEALGPVGTFKTAPGHKSNQEFSFVWAADLTGQG